MRDLHKIRKDVEQFSEEISREFYLQGSGLKQNVDFAGIYGNFEGLFSLENLRVILSEMNTQKDEEELRRLLLFNEAFHNEIMGDRTKALAAEFFSREASGKVTPRNGKQVSYRSAMVRMVNEPCRTKRENIRNAVNRYTEKKINPVLEQIFELERHHVKELGHKNKIDMFIALSGIDLYALDTLMQKFVEETNEVYFKALADFADEKLGLGLSELRMHDVMYLMRAKEFDSLFPAGRMMKMISEFVGKMGIDIKSQKNIVFDLDIRSNKSPRAFCSPVRIPDEVYLVIYPRGGEDDYTAFLHELGHALHFSHIKDDLEFEFKWYGDCSVTEGFAMTFDHLTMNPTWLKNVLKLDNDTSQDFLKHKALNELIMLRRYAAKIHYELKLNESGDSKDNKELYSEIFSTTTGINYSPENYLLDVDPNFYCARYLRAWMFQANMHKSLTGANDCNWFEKLQSGDMLKKMWGTGQKYNAEELMSLYGGESLTMEPVKQEIFKYLKN